MLENVFKNRSGRNTYMCDSMVKIYESICNAQTPCLWVLNDQGEEELYSIEDFKTYVIPCDRIGDIEINCQYTDVIDLMLRSTANKKEIRIFKSIKCEEWEADKGMTAEMLLQRAGIRLE